MTTKADDPKRDATHGVAPGYEDDSAPGPIDPRTGQHTSYWILSEAERAKGFVRPVRRTYLHLKCNTTTSMGKALAETYARDPSFYGATFCGKCRDHFRVGEDGEFVWFQDSEKDEKVGT